jgi:low affinity Fe/Cu permease
MNWPIIIVVGIAVIALIIFLVVRNNKDEKVFEQQLNNDFTKPKEEGEDDEIDTTIK